MIQQLSLAVLIFSFSVIAYIFYKKAPLLYFVEDAPSVKRVSLLERFNNSFSKLSFVKKFSWNSFFQRVLSRTRVGIIKIESMIERQLYSLRKNSGKKNRPG
ncbi:MAG: hypothetical protein WBK67_04430 [Minisyncoccales bacterium]|jgi:hypothetical protein